MFAQSRKDRARAQIRPASPFPGAALGLGHHVLPRGRKQEFMTAAREGCKKNSFSTMMGGRAGKALRREVKEGSLSSPEHHG